MPDLHKLHELMHACVETGFIRGQIAMTPSSGMIRKKDAEALLTRNGFHKVMLSRWVSGGLIKEYKGEKNSPIRYSVMEIMETIGAVRYNDFINN